MFCFAFFFNTFCFENQLFGKAWKVLGRLGKAWEVSGGLGKGLGRVGRSLLGGLVRAWVVLAGLGRSLKGFGRFSKLSAKRTAMGNQGFLEIII